MTKIKPMLEIRSHDKNTGIGSHACVAAIFAVLVSFASNVHSQQLAIDSIQYDLETAACTVGDTSWVQILGPESAQIVGSGDNTRVLVEEEGNYRFDLTCCSAAPASNRIQRLLSSPDRIGFGAPATGGASASSFTVVTSTADSGTGTLREALLSSGPRWIIFDERIHGETIYLDSPINVHNPDFTIDGSGANITISPNSTQGLNLLVFRSGNAIVHDIHINGRGFRSAALFMREGDYYWIDHVTISNIDYQNGLGIGQGSKGPNSASEVTISNYHAYNTQYAVLGGGENEYVDYPPYRVTIHKSNLAAIDRNPRIKNHGTAHVFNNYVHSFTYSGLSAGMNSSVYSQNNVFSANNANNPTSTFDGFTSNNEPAGTVYSENDLFTQSASWRGQVEFVDSIPYNVPYNYTLMDTSDVVEYVTQNAGAGRANLNNRSCQTFSENFTYTLP